MPRTELENLKIGEVAETLDTTVRTIRYYEEEGLVEPRRSAGGTRFYSPGQVKRLRVILQLADNGYSLSLIKTLADTRQQQPTGNDSQQAISAQLDNMLNGLEIQIKHLRQLSKSILATKDVISLCKGCSNEPSSQGCPDCPVKAKLAEIQLLNLIWDQQA